MRRHIPLNAVRAFEAAARHGSLVRAADELCVTPTAVSHQLKRLEEFLQIRLFVRKNGRLELTSEARTCQSRLSEALDLIDRAFTELGDAGSRKSVVVSAPIGCANRPLSELSSELR